MGSAGHFSQFWIPQKIKCCWHWTVKCGCEGARYVDMYTQVILKSCWDFLHIWNYLLTRASTCYSMFALELVWQHFEEEEDWGRGEDAALWCSDIRVISSKEQTCHPILIDWIMEPASGKSSSGPVKNCSCHCAVTKCWSIQSQITGRCNRCLIISIIHFVAADTWHRQVPGLSDARYNLHLHLYLIG